MSNSAEDKSNDISAVESDLATDEEISNALDEYESRKERVERLKEEVQSGNYKFKPLAVAKKIFEKVFKH